MILGEHHWEQAKETLVLVILALTPEKCKDIQTVGSVLEAVTISLLGAAYMLGTFVLGPDASTHRNSRQIKPA